MHCSESNKRIWDGIIRRDSKCASGTTWTNKIPNASQQAQKAYPDGVGPRGAWFCEDSMAWPNSDCYEGGQGWYWRPTTYPFIYIYIDRSIKHSSIDSHFSARAQILRTLHWPYFGWCSKYFMGNSFAFAIFFVIMICVASTRGPWLRLKLMMWWKILTTRWHRTTEAKIAAPWCPNRIRNINTNSSRRFFTHITCKFNSRTIGRTNGRIKYSNSKHGSCRPIHGRSKHRGSCKYKQYKHHYRTWGIATNSKWLGLNFSIKRRATGSIRLANISRSTTTTGRATTAWSRNNCTIYERQHQEETFT